MRRGEQGAALLTVLLLVSVMSVLAASALERLRLSTRLTINAGAIDQARAFAIAAEGVAIARIADLVEADPARTTLVGGWHGRETRLPLPGGEAIATVRDGGNCFNLNSVVTGTPGLPDARLLARPVGIAQFVGLMTVLGINENEARRVADSLADWIDSDETPLPAGAEDAAYAGLPTPYRTANTIVADASELRAVAGVTPEIWGKLRPWVCALPVTDLSPINVNTLLPDQGALLAMLSPRTLGPAQANRLLAARPAGGFESVSAFLNEASRAGAVLPAEANGQLQVRSRWFALTLRVALAGSELDEQALIDASNAQARLVRRSWGEGA